MDFGEIGVLVEIGNDDADDLGVVGVEIDFMKSCVIGRGRGDILEGHADRAGLRFADPDGEHFMPIFVAQHSDVGIIIGVEHQPFQMHLGNHGKRCSQKTRSSPMTDELCTLSFNWPVNEAGGIARENR